MGSSSLALPCPKALVDTRVRVVCGLGAGQLLLHAAHARAERLLTGAAFGLWAFQVAASGTVVRLATKFT